MLICTPADVSSYRDRWGRESCIVWGKSSHADFGPCTHALSIRAVWGGAEYCNFHGRTVGVDDDTFLILNHGRVYATSIRAASPVESLAICFRPALVEAIAESSIATSLGLDDGPAAATLEFFEHLQPHDTIVSPTLQLIREHLERGPADEAWLEERLIHLLTRMQAHRRQRLERMDRLALVRAATRREVCRRVALATDFLHTNYVQPVDLLTLAQACELSKYHLLRLFKLVHGLTPQVFLYNKRVAVALRLLSAGGMTTSAVAASVGFRTEALLLQQLRLSARVSRQQLSTMLRRVQPAAREA